MKLVNEEMKMKEIQSVAKGVGVKFRPGMKKLELIELVNQVIKEDFAEELVIDLETVETSETEEQEQEEVEVVETIEITDPKLIEEFEEIIEGIKEEELSEAPVIEEAPKEEKTEEGIKTYYGGIKGADEKHVALLYKKIEELLIELEANFNDIEYLTSWVYGTTEKNGKDHLVLKLKNVFKDHHLEIVEKHGFEKNRVHFFAYLPLEVKKVSSNLPMVIDTNHENYIQAFVEANMGA